MAFHIADISVLPLIYLSVSFLIGGFLIKGIRNVYFHPLSSIPGPLTAAISPAQMYLNRLSGRGPHRNKALHDKYGPVVRIGPNSVSFINPRAWKDIYGHVAGRPTFLKGDLYDNKADPRPASIVTEQDPARHSKIRRLSSHAFSAKALGEQEDVVQGYVDLLVRQIGTHVTAEAQDMVRWYNWTTFDVIGDLAFGEPFGCLAEGKPHFWVEMILDSITAGSFSNLLFRLVGNVKLAQWLMPKGLQEKRNRHFEYSLEKIERRINSGATRKDFVQKILAEKDAYGYDNAFLASHSSVLIVAGSETTATFLSGVTYYLCRTPHAYAALVAELRTTFASYSHITGHATESLPYLNAVIDEGLRIYPPVPIALPRRSPGETVDGIFIPAGVEVAVDPWAATHSDRNFAAPWEFRPERWLDATSSDRKDASQPFSLGSRVCLGRNLALLEMRLILAKMLWTYDMTLCDDGLDWVRDGTANPLWRKPKLMVRYTKRKGVEV
ncbi:cytochrome P450 [Geopyxis carbonaria]|nr:cytochrome P450 [Geopyxis carbonaria]